MDRLEALLIGGTWPDVMLTALGLLTRAGFAADVISTSTHLKRNKSMRDYFLAEKNDLLVKTALEKIKKKYAIVVVGDDPALGAILNSNLSNEEKLKLIPVLSIENLDHVCSKIGLSSALDKNGIRCPDYLIANNEQELKNSVHILSYPIFIKIDSSSGGVGVFECLNDSDLEISLHKLHTYPVLVQKKIEGHEVSMEVFYQKGELIHFSCSTLEKSLYKYGPTSLRRFVQLAFLDKKIFDQLRLIGKALGADGFVNMSSIQCDKDQELYFIEADMRPNLWCDHSRYFGDDLARIIQRYFSTGKTLKYPHRLNPEYPEKILISHYSRLTLKDLIVNRYRIWKHLPENFVYITLHCRIWPGLISAKVEWENYIRSQRLSMKYRQFFLGASLVGITRSTGFNNLLRRVYKYLPLSLTYKQRLRQIYLQKAGFSDPSG